MLLILQTRAPWWSCKTFSTNMSDPSKKPGVDTVPWLTRCVSWSWRELSWIWLLTKLRTWSLLWSATSWSYKLKLQTWGGMLLFFLGKYEKYLIFLSLPLHCFNAFITIFYMNLPRFQLKQEQENRRNATMMYNNTKDKLRKIEDQHQLEVQERQKVELTYRNLELEMRTLVANIKQVWFFSVIFTFYSLDCSVTSLLPLHNSKSFE